MGGGSELVEGFTRRVPLFRERVDFCIGKPGPGSVGEALQRGLPGFVEKNGWTLPQGRFNADWVKQQVVGEALRSFAGIVPAVERMLAPGRLEQLRKQVAAMENRAVFEIPEILAKLLPAAHTMQQ